MWMNLLPRVHGWMIFMDEIMDETWINFIMNVANKRYFCEKLNKRNKVETIYVGFFQNNLTHEMFKSHSKIIIHISLIWNIFKFYIIYTIHNVRLNPIDPPKGMCQSKHYVFTTKRHVLIRNKDNMKQPTTLHIAYASSSYFIFLFTLSTSCI